LISLADLAVQSLSVIVGASRFRPIVFTVALCKPVNQSGDAPT
jgi:hypothetical protein